VADSSDLAENGHPGLVSRVGCMGRTRALCGTHLGAWVSETGAGEGRTVVARDTVVTASNRACEKVGKRGKIGRRCSLPQRGAPGGTCATAESGGAVAH
jgi:hypothetical protein